MSPQHFKFPSPKTGGKRSAKTSAKGSKRGSIESNGSKLGVSKSVKNVMKTISDRIQNLDERLWITTNNVNAAFNASEQRRIQYSNAMQGSIEQTVSGLWQQIQAINQQVVTLNARARNRDEAMVKTIKCLQNMERVQEQSLSPKARESAGSGRSHVVHPGFNSMNQQINGMNQRNGGNGAHKMHGINPRNSMTQQNQKMHPLHPLHHPMSPMVPVIMDQSVANQSMFQSVAHRMEWGGRWRSEGVVMIREEKMRHDHKVISMVQVE